MNKGAMFGLDSRIALAIFGALSVISGAALFKTIEQLQITKDIMYLAERAKAFESFYIDTAHSEVSTSGAKTRYEIPLCKLYSNDDNVWGWKGPYEQTVTPDTACNNPGNATSNEIPPFYAKFIKPSFWGLSIMSGDAYAGQESSGATYNGCDKSELEACSMYIYYSIASSHTLSGSLDEVFAYIKKLDVAIDGAETPTSGKVIYHTSPFIEFRYYIMTAPK